MKMDPDLLRSILEAYEALDEGGSDEPIAIEGYSESAIRYHEQLLDDQGFIDFKAREFIGDAHPTHYPVRLKYPGHEFLELARNDTFWNNAKKTILEKGGPMTIEFLLKLLLGYAKSTFGLP